MKPQVTTLSLLEDVPYFAGLEPVALESVSRSCRAKAFRAGQTVFAEGDPCRDLYLLESGRVKFFRVSPAGREQTLKVFERRGDTFCLASAFSAKRYIINAAAISATRLHLIPVEAVNRLAEKHPSLALKLVTAAGEHMTHLVMLANDLSLKTVTARLAEHLHKLATAQGGGKVEDVRLPRSFLRTEELASLLGTVRVHISRSFAALAETGAVELTRSAVHIRDVAALKRAFDAD